MTPLRLGTEISVFFVYDQEYLQHLTQVHTLNITGYSNIHTTTK